MDKTNTKHVYFSKSNHVIMKNTKIHFSLTAGEYGLDSL